jgi:small acid-soluble spore protein A (major alpha-type SASP)
MTNTNQFKNVSTQVALEELKRQVAAELGIEIHPDMSARDAGRIGGTVTKRLIALGEASLQQNMMNDQNVNENQLH